MNKIQGKNEKSVERKRHQKLMTLLQAPDEMRFRKVTRPQAAPTQKSNFPPPKWP